MALSYAETKSGFSQLVAPTVEGAVPWFGTITFDATYPAGGEAVSAAGMNALAGSIAHLQLTVKTGDVIPQFNAGKILLLDATTGAETATADQSGTVLHAFAYLVPA